MKKDEWNARFEKDSRDGREVSIGKSFLWENAVCHVPAVYICDEGLILDLCMEYEREELRVYMDKYRDLFDREKNGGKISKEQLRRFQADDPIERYFQMAVRVNGRELRYKEGTGMRWVPKDLLPIFSDDVDIRAFMVHYALDPNKVWHFWRHMYYWDEGGVPELETLELELRPQPRTVCGTAFPMPKVGESAVIPNPLTGGEHILTVQDIRQETIRAFHHEDYVFPENCIVMSYTLEPDIPRNEFFLIDTAESDEPVRNGNGNSSGGAFGVIASDPSRPRCRCAVSSMHFAPVEDVNWMAEFRTKTAETVGIKLI